VTQILQLLVANALISKVSAPAARQIERMVFRAISEIASRVEAERTQWRVDPVGFESVRKGPFCI